MLHGVGEAGLGDRGVPDRAQCVGGVAHGSARGGGAGQGLQLGVGTVVGVQVDVGDDAVDLAATAVLPEGRGVPAAGDLVGQLLVVVRQPQRVLGELGGVAHRADPEGVVGVDDRIATGEGLDLVDPVTHPVLQMLRAQAAGLLEVEGRREGRVDAGGEDRGVVAGLGAGVVLGPRVVVAARGDAGGGGLGGVRGEVRVGVAGALGRLDEGEGLAGVGDSLPVDGGSARVLVAGDVDAVEVSPGGGGQDVRGDKRGDGRCRAEEDGGGQSGGSGGARVAAPGKRTHEPHHTHKSR